MRRWQRDGLLAPHQPFGWQWSRDGETVASIQVRTKLGQVILTYRHRSGGGDWKDESYPVKLDRHPALLATMAGRGHGFAARLWVAGSAWRFSTAARSSPVGNATNSPIPASGKLTMIELQDERTRYEIRERLGWKQGILNPEGMGEAQGNALAYIRAIER